MSPMIVTVIACNTRRVLDAKVVDRRCSIVGVIEAYRTLREWYPKATIKTRLDYAPIWNIEEAAAAVREMVSR